MTTPIFDFVTKYRDENAMRLHMPGHKGKGFLCEDLDITEIVGADCLSTACGIIQMSEENATQLFQTQKTLYSTQGSTLAIQAMLTLVTASQKKPLIIAIRNAHMAFINACALLDIDVKWLYPNYKEFSITSGDFSPTHIENAITSSERIPSAVYITSPNYLGEIADIKGISEVCKKHNVPLLVDNAHGAYLNFLEENQHPIQLGADMCCDSAHKTLPVLTGGAYLHISKSADKIYAENAKSAMSMFSSTSPSYLTLTSLDLCNKYLSENFQNDLKEIIPHINALKQKLTEKGFQVCNGEPLKISIYTIKNGMYGYQLAEILHDEKIECEYADETHIVLMLSTNNTAEEINRLGEVLLAVKFKSTSLIPPFGEFESLKSGMSIREAAFSQGEVIPIEKAEGRICSKVAMACPPGIPIVVCGEIITKNTINILKRYSILSVNVVK